MENKHVKLKNKFLKFLPKPTSMVSFQNPTYSPKRSSDKRLDIVTTTKTHAGRGFSGLRKPMIPSEARRKSKNSSLETQEPTSPKVSCIGQIKHKKKLKKEKSGVKKEFQQHVSLPRNFRPVSAHEPNKKSSAIKSFFGGSKVAGRKSDVSSDKTAMAKKMDKAPSLSKMKRFASGRETLGNFDWATQVAPLGPGQNYYSDDESFDEHDVIVPFSAPIPMGGYKNGEEIELKPKNEINLWKRRTMSRPPPLQIS